MANLPNLKWIPMIAKAYQEARSKVDTPLLPNEPSISGDAQMGPGPVSVKARPTPKGAVRVYKRPKRSNRRPRVRQIPKSQIPKSEYKSVIRELQDTKRKLSRLESIHRQLTDLQSRMESQMSELISKIDKTGVNDAESAAPVDEVTKTNEKPAPLAYRRDSGGPFFLN